MSTCTPPAGPPQLLASESCVAFEVLDDRGSLRCS
jgi:hypothetical protein